jgi:hypothetical protein
MVVRPVRNGSAGEVIGPHETLVFVVDLPGVG